MRSRRPSHWRASLPLAMLLVACAPHDEEHTSPSDSTRGVTDTVGAALGPTVVRDATLASDSGVAYFPAAVLSHVADSLSRGPTTGHLLGARPSLQYLQIRRASSGVPEIHDEWTDVTFVQSGRATLLYGGRVTGGRIESAGEHRGGTIERGSTRAVGAGDLMIIPAGVPHQYRIAPGDTLRYLTAKVRATPR